MVTDTCGHWVVESFEPSNVLIGAEVTAEGEVAGFDRLKVDWLGVPVDWSPSIDRAEIRPFLHQLAPLLEEVRSPIGSLHAVLDSMGQAASATSPVKEVSSAAAGIARLLRNRIKPSPSEKRPAPRRFLSFVAVRFPMSPDQRELHPCKYPERGSCDIVHFGTAKRDNSHLLARAYAEFDSELDAVASLKTSAVGEERYAPPFQSVARPEKCRSGRRRHAYSFEGG